MLRQTGLFLPISESLLSHRKYRRKWEYGEPSMASALTLQLFTVLMETGCGPSTIYRVRKGLG